MRKVALVAIRVYFLSVSPLKPKTGLSGPPSEVPVGSPLRHFFDYGFQLAGDGRDRAFLDEHLAFEFAALDDDVVLAPFGVLIREIFAELSAAAFFAEECRVRDGFRN